MISPLEDKNGRIPFYPVLPYCRKYTFFPEGSQASPVWPSDKLTMNVERCWNDIDKRKPKDSEKENLPHCHFLHHKPHMD